MRARLLLNTRARHEPRSTRRTAARDPDLILFYFDLFFLLGLTNLGKSYFGLPKSLPLKVPGGLPEKLVVGSCLLEGWLSLWALYIEQEELVKAQATLHSSMVL